MSILCFSYSLYCCCTYNIVLSTLYGKMKFRENQTLNKMVKWRLISQNSFLGKFQKSLEEYNNQCECSPRACTSVLSECPIKYKMPFFICPSVYCSVLSCIMCFIFSNTSGLALQMAMIEYWLVGRLVSWSVQQFGSYWITVSQQLLDRLQLNFLQTFVLPRGWTAQAFIMWLTLVVFSEILTNIGLTALQFCTNLQVLFKLKCNNFNDRRKMQHAIFGLVG